MKYTTYTIIMVILLSGCAQQHLTKADKAYDRMAYADAVRSYEKAFHHLDDRDAALRLADAYVQLGDAAKAANWFAYADRTTPLAGDQALAYGRVLQRLGRTKEAALQVEKVLAERPEDPVVRELALGISAHEEFYADTTLYTVRPLNIPGATSMFSAIPFQGGLLLSGENSGTGRNTNPWNGASFLDLYTTRQDANGNWGELRPLDGEVNGRYHDGPAVCSGNGNELYFTRSDYYKHRLNKDEEAISHLMIFKAERNADGSWHNIRSFTYNGADFSAGHPALSLDGRSLYYISDMPGGYGGTDIYRCDLQPDGTWGYPRNLGPTINSAANEMFPTLDSDTLYFSSNGHRNLGGLDIFRSVLMTDEWSTPENLNYPINSQQDDFAFVPMNGGTSGYLSSNRTGVDRIHSFLAHDPTFLVKGTFTSFASAQPMDGVEVSLIDLATGERISMTTGPDGSYAFPLTKGHEYRVQGSKDGMFTESRDVSTVGLRTSRTWTEDFKLNEVVLNKPIVIENIYYDFDRWDIRADAAIELDKVARLFMDNPDLTFELSSHTDSRATDTYNLVLSDARANSAVDYLIRKGVDPSRIKAKGYGESRPVNQCADGVECTEEEHQANRRTEFRVTSVARQLP